MKRVIFIALTFISFHSAFPQEITWFPDNAEWYYTVWHLNEENSGFNYFYTDGDTTVNGFEARVLRNHYQNNESGTVSFETFYFREANDTVFYFSESSNAWGMLYDFNAQPGDVWDLTETLSGTIAILPGEEVVAIVEVDSVATEMLGGEMRKLIYTSPLYDEENSEPLSEWQFTSPIAEGIGPIGGDAAFIGSSTLESPGGYAPHFSCYLKDDNLIHGSDDFPCGIVSSIHNTEVLNLSFFPNPTTNQIRFQLPPEFPAHAQVTIYNMAGAQVLRHSSFNLLSPMPLNLSPGIYLVETKSASAVARTKVVVE